MRSSNLYSHPKRLLEDHLIGVYGFSELFFKEKPEEIKKNLLDVSKVVGLTHDLGKATRYFQEYLKTDEKEKEKLKRKKETHHSLLSAILAYYLVKEIKTDNLLPFFAFITVRRHHGNLRDVSDEVVFDNKDIELLHKQVESIDNENFNVLCEKLFNTGLPLQLKKETLSQWIDDFSKESRQIKRNIRKIKGEFSDYVILNLLYSILLDADKSDVVIKEPAIFIRKEFDSCNWVKNYREKTSFPQSPINNLREEAYNEVTESSINLSNKIYSLNLPTGLGKTLTAFSFAFKLKKLIKSRLDAINPRIIYALPFLSIIDQNANIFEHVIKANNLEPDSDIILKHHHLSEVFYKKDEEEFEADEAKILIEGWNSEIIITTFVQLFHTLISYRNKSIRKFHRLANSIIILDEIQSIPAKYWLLMKNILKELCEKLDSYVIFVTATEPLIFDRDEVKELINKDYYFNSLDRVSLFPVLKNSITINELSEHFDLNDGKTYLFIFNTINSAKDFYNLIKDRDIPLTYLSTHITPTERLKRIKEIKERKYKVLVSTQLVEAGVDIDFDVVVRDFAPLDSINQASGRCNRNGNARGQVFVYILKDENGKKYAWYIYDDVLLNITEKILSKRNEICEREFLNLTEEYYQETKDKKTQDISRRFLEAIVKLRYDKNEDEKEKVAISDFQLIEENYIKKDVFIELNQSAFEIWKQYIKLKNIDDLFERKRNFDSMKANFYQYVISIPANSKNMAPMVGEIGYVKQEILKDYYDNKTGYVIKETRSIVIW